MFQRSLLANLLHAGMQSSCVRKKEKGVNEDSRQACAGPCSSFAATTIDDGNAFPARVYNNMKHNNEHAQH